MSKKAYTIEKTNNVLVPRSCCTRLNAIQSGQLAKVGRNANEFSLQEILFDFRVLRIWSKQFGQLHHLCDKTGLQYIVYEQMIKYDEWHKLRLTCRKLQFLGRNRAILEVTWSVFFMISVAETGSKSVSTSKTGFCNNKHKNKQNAVIIEIEMNSIESLRRTFVE